MASRDHRTAWETGIRFPEGWENGKIEPQAPYKGEGSQVPPAKDRDGNIIIDQNDEWAKTDYWHPATGKVAKRYLERQAVRKVAQRHLAKIAGGPPKDTKQVPGTKFWVTEDTSRSPIRGQKKQYKIYNEHGGVVGGNPDRQKAVEMAKGMKTARTKVAGEVRFIKDRSGDEKQWGWGITGPSEREFSPEYEFKPNKLKPLARALRATLAALGHSMSAYQTFSKIKSATISPDGNLGGKGYIQKIADMRRQYMNIVEALSANVDTMYDEVNASHWDPAMEQQNARERKQVTEILTDVDEIREDPKEWAQGEEETMATDKKPTKTAGAQQPEYVNDLAQVRIRRVVEAYKDRQMTAGGM